MAKLRPGEKRVQISFQRPEDLRLFSFIEKEAYRCRWDVATFCIASLTEAFKEKMEEYEVERLAEEAAQKVRERAAPVAVPEPPPMPVQESPRPIPVVSMEDAAKQAEAQIAQLDAMASTMMTKRLSARKGVGVPPPPPPLPTSNIPATDTPPALPRRKNSAASGNRS